MEKKSSRSVQQPAPRGLVATDSKKSQDGASNKPWLRGGGRRRESSGGGSLGPPTTNNNNNNNYNNNSNNTSRFFDKRPRARGGANATPTANFQQFASTNDVSSIGADVGGGTETAWLEEATMSSLQQQQRHHDQSGVQLVQRGELGSVYERGTKKQHLSSRKMLAFNSTPYNMMGGANNGRSQMMSHNVMSSSRRNGGGGGCARRGYSKSNKESFLQANCQFIVNYLGDYKQYMNNADALVDWDLIEQVNEQAFENPKCPICLDPPIAAKITRCGHIYCWSCMLHYLSLQDKEKTSDYVHSNKCPICYQSVRKEDLKSVVSIPHTTYQVNDTVTFKLMKRQKGSLTAYPAQATLKDSNVIFNVSEKEAQYTYCKLLLANYSQIMAIVDREHDELTSKCQRLLAEEGEEGASESTRIEINFIGDALALVEERRQKILATMEKSAAKDELVKLLDQVDLNVDGKNSAANLAKNEEEFDSSNRLSSQQRPSQIYYFYQASDGQHIYLHPMNARMMEDTYGSLEYAPSTLSGRILEKEVNYVDEDVRNKMRYLQHLPLRSEFHLAEIELQEPVVGEETIRKFQAQVADRLRKRQRRQNEEERREKQLDKDQARRHLGKYETPELHLESSFDFPAVAPTSDSESGGGSEASSLSTSPTVNEFKGPSFATMLASTRRVEQFPTLRPTSSTSLFSANFQHKSSAQAATGSATANAIPISNPRRKFDSDQDPDDVFETPMMSTSCSLGDAIARALMSRETNTVVKEQQSPKETDASGASGKKNKRKKPKVVQKFCL